MVLCFQSPFDPPATEACAVGGGDVLARDIARDKILIR